MLFEKQLEALFLNGESTLRVCVFSYEWNYAWIFPTCSGRRIRIRTNGISPSISSVLRNHTSTLTRSLNSTSSTVMINEAFRAPSYIVGAHFLFAFSVGLAMTLMLAVSFSVFFTLQEWVSYVNSQVLILLLRCTVPKHVFLKNAWDHCF